MGVIDEFVLSVAAAFGVPRAILYNEDMPIEPQPETLFSITEAAEHLGMTRQRMHQLIQDGRLKAQQHGKMWLIPESEIEALQTRIKATGRPRKY